MSEMVIREFVPGDAKAFHDLNAAWITRYFRLEDKDRGVLNEPEKKILDAGGRILFACVDGECVGCCALLRMAADEFEVAKMAVTPAHQGFGIGRKLLAAIVELGRQIGARRLYIETNHILGPAIHLYESLGFRHLPPERVTPSPYARADVFMEMLLGVGKGQVSGLR